jgi:cell wall-associated NlpC family hydrolase
MCARTVWPSVVLFTVAISSGCASTGASRPSPFPNASHGTVSAADPELSGPRNSGRSGGLANAVIESALLLRGTPYRFGGDSPAAGFDCSGLVSYVARTNGVGMPRTVIEQFSTGQSVDRSDLQPGDLVFYSTLGPGPTHVGIVVASDRTPQFIHAPADGSTVRVERLDAPYWERRWVGARRVF